MSGINDPDPWVRAEALEARLREVEAMLTASEEHTQHWQERAEKAEDRLREVEAAFKIGHETLMAMQERADKAEARLRERDELT